MSGMYEHPGWLGCVCAYWVAMYETKRVNVQPKVRAVLRHPFCVWRIEIRPLPSVSKSVLRLAYRNPSSVQRIEIRPLSSVSSLCLVHRTPSCVWRIETHSGSSVSNPVLRLGYRTRSYVWRIEIHSASSTPKFVLRPASSSRASYICPNIPVRKRSCDPLLPRISKSLESWWMVVTSVELDSPCPRNPASFHVSTFADCREVHGAAGK
ncbi:hypothetical protein NEOLEDRAFT_271172 [Neolentinus lepideus HHB14362 ss-1]|uniref:Uncharacterized protein n=1 Tax=Neolentinus lepideus HHB14362 ss-1 TaxID=1314782 RepID=A0A165T489_9AGAM|nr:hypothetical protein NEOLEDRAFT_271172 [Neolentinus lepideus HHB14362 ss-1]